jgi:hypothetical protein
MAATEHHQRPARESSADTVAGFLAAFAILAGALALIWYPGRVGSTALFVGLLACALATRQRRFAAAALAFATLCWVAGMVIAVVAERPVF